MSLTAKYSVMGKDNLSWDNHRDEFMGHLSRNYTE